MPRPISYLKTALTQKLTPMFDLASHRGDVHHILDFMGSNILSRMFDGISVIREGQPAVEIDKVAFGWANYFSSRFHSARIDDSRPRDLIPGSVHLADAAHIGGWYFDFSGVTIMSPSNGRSLVVYKSGLMKLIKGPLKAVPYIGGYPLPKSNYQPEMDATISAPMLFGAYHYLPQHLAFMGGQNMAEFGDMSMDVRNRPDINDLDNAEGMMSDKNKTGMGLHGIGRQASVLWGVAAVKGTVSGIEGALIHYEGFHGVGVKPDRQIKINPREGIVSARPVDLLTFITGRELLAVEDDGGLVWQRRIIAVDESWQKFDMGMASSLRRLREAHRPD